MSAIRGRTGGIPHGVAVAMVAGSFLLGPAAHEKIQAQEAHGVRGSGQERH